MDLMIGMLGISCSAEVLVRFWASLDGYECRVAHRAPWASDESQPAMVGARTSIEITAVTRAAKWE